jgi:hypothetical protein
MDIVERRRANLRRWVAEHGTPPKEKSYFSQLKGTASFGEKVARRLEEQYKMGAGYLDTRSPDEDPPGPSLVDLPEGVHYDIVTTQERNLITLFRASTPRGKNNILTVAELADKEYLASLKLDQL